MSNTIVKGNAPAIELAGAFSDGVFIQNLGTSPVFVGYSPAVSPISFDGVAAPGGNYASSKGRAVYVCSSADVPIVWNNDTGASADAGSQVTATVGGTVNIGNQPTVGVAGTVPVSASAAIPISAASTLPIGGTVAVGSQPATVIAANQNVGATPQHSHTQLYDALQSLTPGAGNTAVNGLDVSSYQSLIVRWSSTDSAPTDQYVIIYIRWISPAGGTMAEEGFAFYASGRGHAVIPVKGAKLLCSITADSANTATTGGTFTLVGVTNPIPEYYTTAPRNNSPNAFTASDTPGTYTNVQESSSLLNGESMTFIYTLTGAMTKKILLPSLARMVNGTLYWNNSGAAGNSIEAQLQSFVSGRRAGFYNGGQAGWGLVRDVYATGAQASIIYFEAQLPKSPLALILNGGGSASPASTSVQLGLAFERF